MTASHIIAVTCLFAASLTLGSAIFGNKDKEQVMLLYSVQTLLVGILVCLVKVAWGGT